MKDTVMAIVATAVIIELNHYLLERSRRKMVAYTIMALLDDLSALSGRAGFRSWVSYLEEAHGKEEALSYIGRLYGTLKRNKSQGEQYDLLMKNLGEYLAQLSGSEKQPGSGSASRKGRASGR
jgi:hypothetical protein